MPMPSVLPMPPVLLEFRLFAPLDAQEASYFAASARIASFLMVSTGKVCRTRVAIPAMAGQQAESFIAWPAHARPHLCPMPDLVVLRPEGLYCPAGDFHIDPWRPVPRAVITHGHSDHARVGMGEYHAATPGLPILQWRLGAQDYHPHDYGASFMLGDARVSLHSAGHVLGSAQVRIEVDGEVWVASGDYKRQHDPSCAPFEVVPCDVFITEATFGLPIYRWPDTSEVAREVV